MQRAPSRAGTEAGAAPAQQITAGQPGLVSQVVVPVEGSTQELMAQDWATKVALGLGVGLRAVHVATGPEDPPEDVFDYLSTHCQARGVPFERTVLHDTDVAQGLVQDLDPTDLVVIGTRLLGTEYHLSSLAQALIRQAPCPIQVLRLQ